MFHKISTVAQAKAKFNLQVMDKQYGLKYLVNFHKLCGTSYLGYSVEKQNIFVKLLSIVWNLVLILNIFCHIYYAEVYTRVNKSKTYLPNTSVGLRILSSVSMMSYFFIGFLHLIVVIKSKQILSQIQIKRNFMNFYETEKTIARKVTLFQLIYILFAIIIYFSFYFIKNQFKFNLFFVMTLLKTLFLRSSECTVIALIAYKSLLIKNQLNFMEKNITSVKFEVYYQLLIQIKTEVQRIDEIFSSSFFVTIAFCIQNQIIGSVFLSIDFSNSYGHIIPHMSVNVILLFGFCYVCSIIPNSMSRLYYSFIKSVVEEYTDRRQVLFDSRKLLNLNLFQIV